MYARIATFESDPSKIDDAINLVRSEVESGTPEGLEGAKMMIVGTPEQCVERLRRYAELGVGDFLLGSMTPVDWQTIELAAESVGPALKAAVVS